MLHTKQGGGSLRPGLWEMDAALDQPFYRWRQILDVEYISLFHTIPYSSSFSNPATARCRVAAGELHLQVCCARRFDETALTGMFNSK